MHSICERALYTSLLAANDFHFRLLFATNQRSAGSHVVPRGRAPRLINRPLTDYTDIFVCYYIMIRKLTN